MPERQYPFIDIAVHARVRDHFAKGDASVLFSRDLGRVLWANDQGASLFGIASVYDFIDAALDPNDLSLRQLRAAATQLSAVGDRRQLLVRIASGFRRLPLNASVELIRIRPGEDAVLFTTPHNGKALTTEERAARMIAGLDGPDTHMAVLDGDGVILAQSSGFDELGLSEDVRRTLVSDVARDRDRLIKRPVATQKGELPAAIGKISDHPALHLLFAVEALFEDVDSEAAPEGADVDLPTPTENVDQPADDHLPALEELPHSELPDTASADRELDATDGAGAPDDQGELALEPDEMTSTPAAATNPDEPALAAEPAVTAANQSDAGETGDRGFAFMPGGRAVRFVWKIDAEGRFSEISEEFAAAVGPKAADVIGETFADLAQRYGLDPDNRISELLRRRDTWSGKTILWPVEGTSLKVPVDLAALPTYSRSREFDGFRGFGIVRVADAVIDEKASGMQLGRTAESRPTAIPSEGENETTTHGERTETGAEPGSDVAAAEQSPDRDREWVDFDAAPEEPAEPEDVFHGERPALRVAETAERPSSGKIVELDQRRPGTAGTLTRGEQAAFREIARQLGEHFGTRAEDEDIEEPASASTPTTETPPRVSDAEEADEATATVEQGKAAPSGDDEALPASRPAIGMSSEILDRLPVGLLVHYGDELLHANPEFLRLTGYRDLESFSREGGLDALFAHADDTVDERPDGTMTLIRQNGQLASVNAHLHSIRWEGKSALMLALAPVGGNDGAQAARDGDGTAGEASRLRMEIAELRSILETATDGVVILGQEGDVRTMNGSASALFNYDEDEIRGKPFAALFAHESQRAVLDYLQGLSGHGVASVLNDGREVIGREANGGFIPLFMTIGRLSSSNGYCAVIRDITQWKRTEEELRNAKRAAETANAHKTEFLARVSHEIRTPLNAIIGFSDMMASEHFGPVGHPRYIEYAGDIGRSGRHVLDIVNDLLDISKIEAGEMDLDFSAVDINDAVSEAVSLVQPQANSQRVIIRTSLSASVPAVVADGRSIKQIALNILANAIRFTPSGGQIVVSTSYEANGGVILRIRDTGIGMTRGELDQAMKPFRQVTTGGRKRGDGTGLGLPLTKAMTEANRAQFSITSTPNEGTLVEISFPSQRVLAN
ncbi:ATP-binding protein [Sinorhizobium terangae]|uniref:histidine kinase n=1 Tax=Sinorhizobium terangae TaxID=110322 RepID=A0A6N7LB17_SINTE|nr:ATP-binding protein [Sinorhizobium terangae]MBB4184051.1 PAS domain S-box-containing protein [Sinorhizobium terangae]MQX14932.1 PAS domain S-box protein [Sinorhizobium terangae]WFU48153.1 PAS domain S-box protein [Sinorhizobium terangae]